MLKRVFIAATAATLYGVFAQAAKAEPPSTVHIVLEDWLTEAAKNSTEPYGAEYDKALAPIFRKAVTDCISFAMPGAGTGPGEVPFKWLGRVNENGEVFFSLVSTSSQYAQCFQMYMRDAKLPKPPTMTPAFMHYGAWAIGYDAAEHDDAIPLLRNMLEVGKGKDDCGCLTDDKK